MSRKKTPIPKPASKRSSPRPSTGRKATPRRVTAPPSDASGNSTHLRAIVELAEDAVYIKDSGLRYLFVNPAAVKYLGVPAKKLIGKTDVQVFGRALSREVEAIDRAVIKNRETVTYERRGESAGRERVFLTTKVPYLSAGGSLLGLIGISRDITGRALVEEKLARSESKHRLLLNSIQTPVLALDDQLTISYCNQAYAAFVGKPAGELQGMNLLAAFPRLRNSPTLEAYRRALSTGKTQTVTGKMGDRYLSARVFKTPDGLLALAEDVTEKKIIEQKLERTHKELEVKVAKRTESLSRSNQALQKEAEQRERTERALRDSDNKFRAILENSLDIITILNEDGVIKYANSSLTAVLGYEIDDILGKSVFEYLHPSDTPKAIKIISDLQQQPGAALTVELRLHHADGGWRLLDVSGKYIPQSQILGGIVVNARDVTEGRQAQDEAREAEERQRLLFDLAPDAYFLCDLKGRLADCNQAFERMAGCERAALIGKSLWDLDLLPLEQAPELTALLSRNALGSTAGSEEFTLRASDGRVFRAEIKTHPVKIKGQPLMLGVITDVTAARRERDHEQEYYRGLEFLSRTANKFVKLDPALDLPTYITGQLSEWLGGVMVGINLYEKEANAFCPRAVAGFGPIQSAVERLLGFNPLRQQYTELPEDIHRDMIAGRLVKLQDGIFELFFRVVPRAVCRAIETQFKVTGIHAMGLVSNQRLLGAVTIILRDGQDLATTAIIETFINQAAVALERRLDEDELRRGIVERERAAVALRTSEEFNRAVIDHSPLGISVRNAKGELLTCNAAWKQVWGISDEAMIQDIIRHQPELVRENDESFLAGWRPAVQRVYREGGTLFIPELMIPGGDDAPDRWVELHFYALKSGDGAVEQVIIITEDITKRRENEETLKHSEQHFRALIERSSEVITILDHNGVIRYKSPSVTRELGYDPAELVGKPVFDYIHPDDGPALRQSFSQFLQNPGEEGAVEFRFRHKDGRWVVLSAAGKNLLKEPAINGIVINSRNVTERKQAEEDLRESDRQYREVFDGVAEGIYRTTPDGRVLMANPALVRMLRYDSLDDLLRRNITAEGYLDETTRREFMQRIERDGWVRDFVNSWKRKDGSELVVSENARAVRDSSGQIAYYEGTVEDITDKTRVEQELQESEKRYRALAETSPDMIFTVDHGGFVRYVNATAARYIGREPADVIGRPIAEFFPDDIHQRQWQNLQQVFASGEPLYKQNQSVFQGHSFWLDSWLVPLKDARGGIDAVMGISRDITGRKQAEQALGISEERFRKVFEDGPIAMAMLDGTFRFLQVNAAFMRFLGYSQEEIRNLTVPDITHPDHLQQDIENSRKLLRGEIPFYRTEKRYVTKTRSIVWGSLQVSTIRDNQGELLYALAMIDDITARKQAELALQESEAKYRALFDQASDGIMFMPVDGSRILVNGAFALMHGYDNPVEMESLRLEDIDTPETAKLAPERLRRMLAGETLHFEVEHHHRDGHAFPLNVSCSVIRIGEQSFFLGFHHDISARKQAERALIESELRFRELADSLPETVFEFDLDRRFTYINSTGFKKYGYSPDDFRAGLFVEQMIAPEDREEAITRIIARLRGGQPVRSDYTAVRKDGTRFPAQIYVQPVLADGAVTGLRGILIDVTQMRQAELQYRSTLDAMNDNIHLVDRDLKIRFINQSFLELNRSLGLDTDVVGKDLFAVYPFLGDDVRAQYQQVFETGALLLTHERTAVGGEDINTETRKIPVFDSGQVNRVVTVIRDVTERTKAEERIRFLTFHDRLTGLFNRACFEERVVEFDTPGHFPLSLIMGDANGLKLVNDAFGHDAGDKFLHRLAGIIKTCVRPRDLIFRWGGDEFVILMPATDNEAAQSVCEAIHRACGEAPEEPIRPSIALGAGTKTGPGQSISQVMMEAEDRMYRHKLVESKSLRSSIISSLGRTLWEADYETEEHALRLQAMAKEFGRALKLTDSEMNDLMMLAALHDIGKIAIADGILLKPSMLSEEEWEIVRKHPEIGFRIAQSSPELAPIADGILHHHERWDGGGYPQGLRAENIPVIARILSIIDAYDVMTEKRLYKTTVSKEEAIAELERCAGSQFDPKLVGLFIKIITRK